jgi:peptide/nickel transport system substrate-binding protein
MGETVSTYMPYLRMSRTRSARVWCVLAAVIAAMLLGSYTASGASSKAASQPIRGGNATFAMTAGSPATYILPLMPVADATNANLVQFQKFLFRPLYWIGDNGKVVMNPQRSLANTPSWSADGKTVTVTLKHYKWSNGTAVNARDIEFWQNLVKATKATWAFYVPGDYPDNITATKIVNPTTIKFTLDKAYNHNWFLLNELSQITPLPLAWDRTSATGSAGSADLTPSGAMGVYKYLTAQAQNLLTYASNPLWKIVDGPWTLKKFLPTGDAVFVPNNKYSGSDKPKLASFEELPFTSNSAEFNGIKSGQSIDVGFIPPEDAAQVSQMKSQGYSVNAWVDWNYNFMSMNFNNPTVGPIFKQLYVRQALQDVENQPALVKSAFHGYAWPVYGPVPPKPDNNLVSALAKQNPYPFSIAAAKKLIATHGWTVSGGIARCTSPGSGAKQCGSGVASGAALSFNLQYASGFPALSQSMQVYKSNASGAGIDINLTEAPINTVFGNMSPCAVGPKCNWQMGNYGVGWTYLPDYYPTGDETFQTGAGANFGNYSNPTNDANILATETAPPAKSLKAMMTYQNFLVKNLPVIWQPNPHYQITLVKSGLHGVLPQDPTLAINPEDWYFTK